MAVSPELVSLDSLLEWEPEDEGDKKILERIKKLAYTYLPSGWREWKVIPASKEAVLGEDLDPQVLNKIRFALPTVEVARAFSPGCISLPERVYRDMKLKMLEWPLCVGLIVGPPAVAARIRNSAVQNELVLGAISKMAPLFLTRKQAALELSKDHEDDSDSVTFEPPAKIRKISRLDKLEHSHIELKEMLSSLMQRFDPPDGEDDISVESSDEEQSILCTSQPSTSSQAEAWTAPVLPIEDADEFDFSPRTREIEPSIPPPQRHIEEQGIKCQRLGDVSFNLVRYADVQKNLQASPVFSALKVNSILPHPVGNASSQDLLFRADTTLGTISHGLLMQRDSLVQVIRDLSSKHPSMKSDLVSAFSGDNSTFKSVSDDLLQYTCGRRAEIIEMRRNSFIPKNDVMSSALKNIPPSSTHIFSEAQLSELSKQPAFQEFFRSFKQSFKHRQYTQQVKSSSEPRTQRSTFRQRKSHPLKTHQSERVRQPFKSNSRRINAPVSRNKPSKGYTAKRTEKI